MTRFAMSCAFMFGVSCVSAQASEPTPSPAPATSIELGGTTEHLSNGAPNWMSRYLAVSYTFSPRKIFYASLTRDARFGQTDETYLAGVYFPLAKQTTINIEESFSPSHAVLPRNDIGVSLGQRFPRGWGLILALRNRSYTGVNVNLESFKIDRYWKSFRAAYTLGSAHLSNAPGTYFSQSFLVTDYYGNAGEDSVTFAVHAGREVENTGDAITASTVTGAGLYGIHWVNQRLGFSWAISTLQQGTFYTRSGVQIGIRGRF